MFGFELGESAAQREAGAAGAGRASGIGAIDSAGNSQARQPAGTYATTAASPVDPSLLELSDFQPDPGAVLAFFGVLLVALWLALTFAASRDGWAHFASGRTTVPAPQGRKYRAVQARFGGLSAPYRNVVFVTFSHRGMYFSTPWTFRPFHPPFLIPWSSVKTVQRKSARYPRRYRIEIEDAAGRIFLRLAGDFAGELKSSRRRVEDSSLGVQS